VIRTSLRLMVNHLIVLFDQTTNMTESIYHQRHSAHILTLPA